MKIHVDKSCSSSGDLLSCWILLNHFLNLSAKEEVNLRVNESQLKSIQSVFNHRINLIQGPPGTGKSYVGKLLLQILLKNEHVINKSKIFFDRISFNNEYQNKTIKIHKRCMRHNKTFAER